ncbi:hypothetical protein IGI04_024058 [Brassica rapa subsp. trilocularis]|uniref:Uncharacterized protein n=1 Tax=Brassica rapa subsp. trilocularis TaxID=1813537 RepID=A0ABQ7M5M2_BRACM|nr:hypothetical protein IGI04_024058 [Brassica rapa subsp. trilocularis]
MPTKFVSIAVYSLVSRYIFPVLDLLISTNLAPNLGFTVSVDIVAFGYVSVLLMLST